jgi:hypothetical protein
MKTITIKTELEQFQEQYPELYQQIWTIGYDAAHTEGRDHYEDDSYDPSPWGEPEYAKRVDESSRYYYSGTWQEVYNRALKLDSAEFKAGNKDWKEFMGQYKEFGYSMYIAWNPTHKLFVVESDMGAINEYYPHLVDADLNDIND